MAKTALEKKQVMISFIDAASQIMDNEGIESITARRVANLAGHNVAIIYRYFNNLDHLIFFVCVKYYNKYVHDLYNYVNINDNTIKIYYNIWKCFCVHSFNNPQIFKAMFLNNINQSFTQAINNYYELFPEELESLPKELSHMLDKENIHDRDKAVLLKAAEDNYIDKKDLNEISEVIIIFYEGILARLISDYHKYTKEDALNLTLKFIRQILKSYCLKDINLD